MGDEPLNPYLPHRALSRVTGDKLQSDVETDSLYESASVKFDIYHLAVNDKETCYNWYEEDIKKSFGKYLDEKHFRIVNLNSISNAIVNIVTDAKDEVIAKSNTEISW